MTPFAATGVPTAQALAQELRALLAGYAQDFGRAGAGKAASSNGCRPMPASWCAFVRSTRRPATMPSAVLARLEIDAAKADIAAALADLGKLADATRAPAQAWIDKAQARQAALAAARQFAADTARALGPR